MLFRGELLKNTYASILCLNIFLIWQKYLEYLKKIQYFAFKYQVLLNSIGHSTSKYQVLDISHQVLGRHQAIPDKMLTYYLT